MPQYLAYPKSKDTPSRKARKGIRQKTFLTNKAAAKKLYLARKEAQRALLDIQEEVVEE